MKLNQLVEFNPKETIKPNTLVKKISMDQLGIFTRKIANFSYEFYSNGSKFRNGDTLMARITPCLENGKTAYVNMLDENEVAFGSTEFIVIRAKPNVCINEFAYYLTISSLVRPYAIESMIGSTGRQRVQQDLVENLEIPNYSMEEQQHIVNTK